MAEAKLRVAVIDDDFMIAKLHGRFVEEQPGYELAGVANNYEQALSLIKQNEPNLLLLDVFLPDQSGIELLREVRAQTISCDVILITASKEVEVVEEGFRLGVFDYLIKPFDLEHLKNSLTKYAQYQARLGMSTNLDQKVVNDLKKLRSLTYTKQISSGIDFRTLDRIRQCLTDEPKSADDIARSAGVSRSTARTYLTYLVEEGSAKEELLYGTIGRPQRVFRMT